MERKIGEVFTHNGVNLEVVEVDNPASCNGCYFDYDCDDNSSLSCSWGNIDDGFTFVIFKEV